MPYARRLTIEGLCNARDLGGYPTARGGVTRFGVFVRSEAPCGLTADAVRALRDYGVCTTADLRGLSEIELRPSDLQDEMAYFMCPLAGDAESFSLNEAVEWSSVYIRRAEDNRPGPDRCWSWRRRRQAASCSTAPRERTGPV